MQRSSETIGAIASALAKAQTELTNPEKSLTGTIISPFPREENKTFRYASLSSGLEIVRKCLGKHEIAAIQTTAIDKESGLIRLTTTLAHASGEWMASEWPVCPVSETNAPHRLGAALTYARRHSLFTLVGIAGDDDRDAPDLGSGTSAAISDATNGANAVDSHAASVQFRQSGSSYQSSRHTAAVAQRRPVLTAEQSSSTRDRLVDELEAISGAEALAAWAQRILPVKNTLTSADAQAVEAGFAARLGAGDTMATPADEPSGGAGVSGVRLSATKNQQLSEADENASHADPAKPAGACLAASPPPRRRGRPRKADSASVIDKSVLAFPEPRRLRDREHLKFVAGQPCLLCGRRPSDPHHLRFTQPRALGRKVSDEFTVPLCRTHHRQLHGVGDERSWWGSNQLDPMPIAEALWRQTHPLAAHRECTPSHAASPRPDMQCCEIRPSD